MKKIPTIFKSSKLRRGFVLNAINPECQWVFDRDKNDQYAGGVLRKYDGLCCMIEDGYLWKRTIVPNGETSPTVWRLIQLDDINNTTVIWEPVEPFTRADEHYMKGLRGLATADNGTYELIGPDIKGNPEKVGSVRLMRHDHAPSILLVNRTFEVIRDLLKNTDVYGYVFTHPDGRKAKINRTHFGFDRLERGLQ